jgi:hypothetical protein
MQSQIISARRSVAICLCCMGAACATPVTTAQAGCSSLIPEAWAAGVAGAPLPAGDTVGDWIAFGDAQTGRLDTANDRTKSAIEIERKCEARDAKALKPRGLFGRLFG